MYYLLLIFIFPLVVSAVFLFNLKNSAKKLIIYLSSAFLLVLNILFIANTKTYFPLVYSLNLKPIYLLFLLIVFIILCLFVLITFKYNKIISSSIITTQILSLLLFNLKFFKSIDFSKSIYIDSFSIILLLLVTILSGIYFSFFKTEMTTNNKIGPLFYIILSMIYASIIFNNILMIYLIIQIMFFTFYLIRRSDRTSNPPHKILKCLGIFELSSLFLLAGLVVIYVNYHVLNLSSIIELNRFSIVLPLYFICFSLLILCEQIPFTKTADENGFINNNSGIFIKLIFSLLSCVLLIRISPLFYHTETGFLISLIGGMTYLYSLIKIIGTDNLLLHTKYYFISNTSLIISCIGLGRSETTWASITLIFIYMITSSLIFMILNTYNGTDNLRDNINKRDKFLLLSSVFTVFIFIFGIVICNWNVLNIFANYNTSVPLFVIPGIIISLFLILKTVSTSEFNVENTSHTKSNIEIYFLFCFMLLFILAYPFISKYLLLGYSFELYLPIITTQDGIEFVVISAVCVIAALGFSIKNSKSSSDIILNERSVIKNDLELKFLFNNKFIHNLIDMIYKIFFIIIVIILCIKLL